ncbi:MAG: hypothetical protein M1396_04985 [Chloroflexi bacterium]|nr:hypothetical protein [Chloroflexota bacterium]
MLSIGGHPRILRHGLAPEQVSAIWQGIAAAALVVTLILSALFESGQLAGGAGKRAGMQRPPQSVPSLNSPLDVEVNEHAFCVCLQGGR